VIAQVLAASPPNIAAMSSSLLDNLSSPVLLHGNERIAYRDPCAVYDAGRFALYFTLVEIGDDGLPWLFTAMSESTDLQTWSAPQKLTPQDRARNFSSPGSILRHESEWVMCLQTYPRQNGEKYANDSARLWTMRSGDLREWSEPELMRVKGPNVPDEDMGRMIDPYLVADKDDPGLFWCLFKQNGASRSSSRDLRQWDYHGHFEAGENVCVIADEDGYWLFHSPENGIGLKRSTDLAAWEDIALFTLGQAD
jgi:hypothetical protein